MKPCERIRTALIVFCLAAQAWGAPGQQSQAAGTPSQESRACALGDQALAQKEPYFAVIEYNKCLSKNPPTFMMLSNLGIAYAQQKRFPEAIQAYGQALALDPDNATVRINLGLAYMKTDRPKEASAEFARSLMANPHDAKALELLAYAHFALGEFALAGYEAGVVYQASPGDPSAAYILGASYLRLGMNVQAIPLIESSLAQVKSAEAYMVLGEALLAVKNGPAALEAFRKAEKMNPSLPGLYADLGAGLGAMAELDEAKAAFLKELARDPDDFKANFLLGQWERHRGDNAEALKYLEKASKLQPDNPNPAYELSVLASESQDYQKAEEILESILKRLPSFTDGHVLLAQVYSRLHKTQESARERAIAAALQEADHARLEAEGRSLKWLSGGKSEAQTPRDK
jgi:tetratricopeptide (TPR) repeat protein